MVTTRSADRYAESDSAEDLILRSRTVSVPNSSAATPSSSRKRSAKAQVQVVIPPTKRPRLSLNGANDHDSPPNMSPVEEASSATITVDIDDEQDHATPRPTREDNIPSAALASSPDRTPQAYRTPATSKHQRFGSAEPEENSILVKHSTDMSTQQGFETAEEEIEDSDAAPEVESTKVKNTSRQPRRSARAPRSKQKTSTTSMATEIANVDETRDINEPIQSTTETEPSDEVVVVMVQQAKDEPAALTHDDLPSMEKKLAIEDATIDDIPEDDSATEPVISHAVGSADIPAITAGEGSPLNDQTDTSELIGLETQISSPNEITEQTTLPTMPPPPPTSQPTKTTFGPDPPSFIAFESSPQAPSSRSVLTFPARSRLTKTHRIKESPFAFSDSSSRLPSKSNNSLESYRRNKLTTRAAQRGGLGLESTWAKKRSAFAVRG